MKKFGFKTKLSVLLILLGCFFVKAEGGRYALRFC
jgi:hypothetical protein